jgi:hypothetical protein
MAVALGIAFLVALRHPGGRAGVSEEAELASGEVSAAPPQSRPAV